MARERENENERKKEPEIPGLSNILFPNLIHAVSMNTKAFNVQFNIGEFI